MLTSMAARSRSAYALAFLGLVLAACLFPATPAPGNVLPPVEAVMAMLFGFALVATLSGASVSLLSVWRNAIPSGPVPALGDVQGWSIPLLC
jgi:hypothetical protein